MPIERHASSSRWAPAIGFSGAVRAGDWITVAGTTAIDAGGSVVGGDSAYEQAREALGKISAALGTAGASLEQVVQTRMFVTDSRHSEEVGRAHGEVFGSIRPVATMVVVALLDPRMLIEIEATAYTGK